jgi:hypothetical protein
MGSAPDFGDGVRSAGQGIPLSPLRSIDPRVMSLDPKDSQNSSEL